MKKKKKFSTEQNIQSEASKINPTEKLRIEKIMYYTFQ